jgi:hypothetical protein
MNNFFEQLSAALRPTVFSGLTMHNHLLVVKAIRKACQEMSPGCFTSLMVYDAIHKKFPGVTPHDVRQVIGMFEQEMKIADVGSIRQGHASVPAYIVRKDAWK